MTRTPLSSQKVKVTRPLYSQPCLHVRQLHGWAWERDCREKLLLRCRLLGHARPFGAHGGGEGRGHIVEAARLQLVIGSVWRTAPNIPDSAVRPRPKVFSDKYSVCHVKHIQFEITPVLLWSRLDHLLGQWSPLREGITLLYTNPIPKEITLISNTNCYNNYNCKWNPPRFGLSRARVKCDL